ncbi:major facilitator superfamily domain-containing protein 12-like isoform X2 [Oratosquilla oratoria]|uniref:major facilitator superfamily domain-containing protein 12-like isoform X2 n=1 Tax=Oratosquilla oratoria TaxID=337810 RepID=UPI003F7664B8
MTLSLRLRAGFGFGHVLNDLCSALWFTYLLVYFHHVLLFDNTYAGLVLLIGQIADGLATPFVGRESDRQDDTAFCSKYGKRKVWHFAGCLCVLLGFPFIFLGCIHCEGSEEWAQVMYYAPFVIIFQFGWASTQINHLSLIPDLARSEDERTDLNSIRYAFTVMSNITVYLITWIVLGIGSTGTETTIGPEDAYKFRYIVGAVLVIGAVFVILFHVLVKENVYSSTYGPIEQSTSQCQTENAIDRPIHCRMAWNDWFAEPQFYLIAMLYMCTRLFCNITQSYVPIYLQDSLHLHEQSLAYIPLVMYLSGFITSMVMNCANKKIGRKATFLIGCVLALASCVGVLLGKGDLYKTYLLYGVAVLMGAGGSTMLVTSLSLTADLIGPNSETGAFVYGAMSFTDKLSNGITVMVIQSITPCTSCCPDCNWYFRNVLGYGCGLFALLAIVAILLLLPAKIGHRRKAQGREASDNNSHNVCNESHLETVVVNACTAAAKGQVPVGVCAGPSESATTDKEDKQELVLGDDYVSISQQPEVAEEDPKDTVRYRHEAAPTDVI